MAAVAIVGGFLLLTMVVLLALSLEEISATRDQVTEANEKADRAVSLVRPAFDELEPAIDAADEDAVSIVRSTARLIRPLRHSGDDIGAFIERLPVLQSGLQGLIRSAVPLVEAVDAQRLASTAEVVLALGGRLIEGDRLVGTLDQARRLLSEVEERSLIARAVRGERTLRRVLHVQRRTLRVLIDALRVQRRSLDHIRSIDRKTGGEIPPD